jgi:hypothetical protein
VIISGKLALTEVLLWHEVMAVAPTLTSCGASYPGFDVGLSASEILAPPFITYLTLDPWSRVHIAGKER